MKDSTARRFGGSSLFAVALSMAAMNAPALAQEPEPPAASAAEAAPGIAEWDIVDSEVQADPSITYGRLENGMRYALKRNTQPAGEASMRLLFEVGMRDERDGEEGAAHFLEHMAFNGSTNIPEGQLVPRLERLGLAFGADTNAETFPHYTMYKLDLPKLDDATVDASLEILRDMAGELTIAPEAVEREKGILISEYQVRNSQALRRHLATLRDIMADSRIADRGVAEPEAFNALTAATLRGFYEGYYRPERATMVIVGDFDPAEMASRLAEEFSDWRGTGEARERYVPEVAKIDDTRIATFVDPATPELGDFQRVLPYVAPGNTVDEFRSELLDIVAARALNNRLAKLAKMENPTTLGGQATAQSLYDSARVYGMFTIAADGKWRGAFQAGEQEWRRAALHGFTASEIEDGLSALASIFETTAAQATSARSNAIASEIALSSLRDSVRQSPEQSLALYRVVAPTITPELVHQNFLAKWGEAPAYVQLASKTPVEDAEDVIAQVLAASAQVDVEKPQETVTAAFAYTDFGAPGTIVSDTVIEDLGIRAIEFANGVQLNLKKTDFEPGKVSVQLEVGRGLSAVEAQLPGLALVTQLLAPADDLGAHEADELQRILAGRQVTYGYGISQEAVSLSATTTPDDLLLQLQLMAGQITDTAFSAQAQRQWSGIAPIIATNILADPGQLHGLAFAAVLAGGDPRLGFVDPAVLTQRSMADLKSVVGTQFANGALEIGIVGDLDEDAAIAAAASTLGALDRPASRDVAIEPARFRDDRGIQTLYHTGQADQGMISASWPTDDDKDLRSVLTRRVLAELINLRATEVLREELGATYTPSVISSSSAVYDGFGHISVIAPATPSSMGEVSRVIRSLVAEFDSAAPSEDALLRARQPVLERYERAEGTNSGWVGLVVDAQSRPDRLDDRRNRASVLSSITPADIQAAAKQYLVGEPVEIRVIPQAVEESGD